MLQKITDRVWLLPQEEELDRPYLYYIKGDESSLAVDAGSSPAHVEKFYAALQAEGLPLPGKTVLTHWHWDHSFGLCAISGESWAGKMGNDKLREVSHWRWSMEDLLQREEQGLDSSFCRQYYCREYPDLSQIRVQPADHEIEEETEFSLGGCLCRLIPRDSPHSRDAVVVYLPGEKVLFTGDAAGVDFLEFNRRHDPARLQPWIEFIRSLDVEWILSGHRPPQRKEDELRWLEEKLLIARRQQQEVQQQESQEDPDLAEFKDFIRGSSKGSGLLAAGIFLAAVAVAAGLLLSEEFRSFCLGLLGLD